MTHLSPRALEALTKGLCKLLFDHGDLDQLSSGKTKAILEKEAAAILTALEAEGMVVVPADLASRIWKDAENCVPTNWCDDLLTGPNCPKGPLNCPDVEKLLLGVIKRMRDKAALQAAQGGDDASH